MLLDAVRPSRYPVLRQWRSKEQAHFTYALGYHSMAVGSLEFDSGLAALASSIRKAIYAILSATGGISAEPALPVLGPA